MKLKKPVLGYLRVSGRGQLDGDGFKRQEKKVLEVLDKHGRQKERIYREEGVSGRTALETADDALRRKALYSMIEENESGGTIVVENLSRLARMLTVQEQITFTLKDLGFDVYSADTGSNVTQAVCESPMGKFLFHVQGAASELDSSLLVEKLRVARERKAAANKEEGKVALSGKGKCSGRRAYFETVPRLVALVHRLRRGGNQLPLRKIVLGLELLGYKTSTGKPYSLSAIAAMAKQKRPDMDVASEATLVRHLIREHNKKSRLGKR